MWKEQFDDYRKTLFSFFKSLSERIRDHDISGLAAQLAYFFLLSLFPLLIFIVTLLPYTPLTEEDIFFVIKDFLPLESFTMIEKTLSEVMTNRSGGLLSVGIIGTLWSASKGMNAMMKSLNRAYQVEEERSFVMTRGLAVVLTLALIFLFMFALLIPVFGKQIGLFIFSNLGLSEHFLSVWDLLRWSISPVILFCVFFSIYYLAPSVRIPFKSTFPGAIFSSLGWIIVSFGFSYYVSTFGNYSATYGSIGGVVVLMLWFYISAIIIMVGGEINSLLFNRRD